MLAQSATILVIDADTDFTDELSIILAFIRQSFIVSNSLDSWHVGIDPSEPIKAVIVRCDEAENTFPTLLNSIKEFDVNLPVIVVQGESSYSQSLPIDQQILGALERPIGKTELLHLLAEAEAVRGLSEKHKFANTLDLHRELVGTSRPIQQVRQLINQVASSAATVLILGESGTGKEVVAQALHDQSPRKPKPFVPVNCGAIPPDLLESELFGHEKGAFTGAITARKGRFEMADGGTLFLDEIGDMSLGMQVKLLRVLQEKSFERVGSNKTIKANVRIVAATHHNLENLVDEGRFRLDLFYRLNVFPIEVPKLSDHREDIPQLIKRFISRLKVDNQASIAIAPSALAALANYPWPGNVRELSNLIERLSLLYPGSSVQWQDLPAKYRANGDWVAESVEFEESEGSWSTFEFDEVGIDGINGVEVDKDDSVGSLTTTFPKLGLDLKQHLRELEIGLICQALEEADGVVSRAAKLLKLQRTTLVEKIRKFEINRIESASGF